MRWKTTPIALEESDATPDLPDATNRCTLEESDSDIFRIQNFENLIVLRVQHASNFLPHVWLGQPLATVHSTGTLHIGTLRATNNAAVGRIAFAGATTADTLCL